MLYLFYFKSPLKLKRVHESDFRILDIWVQVLAFRLLAQEYWRNCLSPPYWQVSIPTKRFWVVSLSRMFAHLYLPAKAFAFGIPTTISMLQHFCLDFLETYQRYSEKIKAIPSLPGLGLRDAPHSCHGSEAQHCLGWLVKGSEARRPGWQREQQPFQICVYLMCTDFINPRANS